ncbi:Deoxyribonuclease Tat-D [Fulvia fulva]|uniref:Deoxyribonuclease Tat-D n=1 Tax=Passalora fulva TaxID=5499 RepID=A0A9Q8LJ71_PASFU|nr:Deoxyribonuclease Tat-D [Fulvia fulva]KAK4623755.1 Deoxyribonuclease Tat-D [Fulvia fulva]KAK4626028.1 Deoxyribonuclease Tat-D [Fulvia fulva]UJO18370.1 Deoxyribonuclease Tat-D [Fulvia fulva]WPV15424.1 Deoxyribonuclease Tat-D [Fulvia fulva]WPV29998.1 Deoxyribonuclease Tat-D [Fulvia fulva]
MWGVEGEAMVRFDKGHISCMASSFTQDVARIRDLSAESPGFVSAFGELGLDYDRLTHASKEMQIRTFKAQLNIFVTEKLDLPLFLHFRAACEDFIDIIRPYLPNLPNLPRGGLVHSFVGSKEEMQALVDMGF